MVKGRNLHEAVLSGDLSSVVYFLTTVKSNVNERDTNGNTPLLLAICIKDEASYNSIIETLIENEADVDICNKGITPLYNAVFHQREKSVEMLVKAGAKTNHKNLLHIAAQNGCRSILSLLLEDKVNCDEAINTADDRGRTPVYIAALQGHQDCLKMLIGQGADLSYTNVQEDRTVMDVIFEEVPTPAHFLIELFDGSVHKRKINEKISYFIDFSALAPKHCTKQMNVISSLLAAANDEDKTQVLQHPLIELYLTLKWDKICYFFYLWIAAYIVFVLSISLYVTILTRNYDGSDNILTAAKVSLLITSSALLCHGILQCCLTHRNHFRKYEMWLNIACTSLSLIVAVVEVNIQNMPNWVLHITSVAILLSWTELMLLIGRLPTYGYYALMFSAVLQNVIRVLLAFSCLVIGFALSFSIQFRNYNQFSDPWRALVKTTVMMMGEFEYGELFADNGPAASRLIFLMFIILTSIVLMNLMVGLAVSDIQMLQMQSHARKLEKQADFLAQVEKVLSAKQLKSKYVPNLIKKLVHDTNYIDATFELQISAQFRRTKKLSSRLIDSLVAIAKSHREKNDCIAV